MSDELEIEQKVIHDSVWGRKGEVSKKWTVCLMLEILLKIHLNIWSVNECVNMAQRLRIRVGTFGAGVPGECEPPHAGSGTRAQRLWKKRKCSWPLIRLAVFFFF